MKKTQTQDRIRKRARARAAIGWCALLWLWPGLLWATPQVKLLQYDPDVQHCRSDCHKPGQWKDIPGHGMLPDGSWLKLDKGSQVTYKHIGLGHKITRRKGPARFRLRRPSHKRALPVRLWRKVVASIRQLITLKGRLHSAGATRSNSRQITQRRRFVDLSYPRYTHLPAPPKQLRWQRRKGIELYTVSLWYEGKRPRYLLRKKQIRCRQQQCQLSLSGIKWQRQRTYRWHIQRGDCKGCTGYPRAGVSFKILPGPQQRQLKGQLKRLTAPKGPYHHLRRALIFLRHRCFYDALRALGNAPSSAPAKAELHAEIVQYICRPWQLPKATAALYPCDDEPR